MSTSQPTPPAASAQTIHMAGILTTIHGLSELPTPCTSISCLWLLHPRLGTAARLVPFADAVIAAYNAPQRRRSSSRPDAAHGLLVVTFDQRNHGSRAVHALANESWKEGNSAHAPDMFGVFNGTARDVGALMEALQSYVLVDGGVVVRDHFVLGVSLGGHAAWELAVWEERVSAVVVVVGCADYMRIMKDRARLSKRESYTKDDGASFLGSVDFPSALIKSCLKYDPKGIIFGTDDVVVTPSAAQQADLRAKLDATIKGKALLVCSGTDDKLVPYHCSKDFLDFLKTATAEGGWYADGGVYLEDNVYEGVGHTFSPGMIMDAIRFIVNVTDGREPGYKESTSSL